MACLQNTRKNSIVWPRDIADDPASLAFEAIETIIWKLPIAPVVRIVSKYFETTGAIGTIRTITWKPGLRLWLKLMPNIYKGKKTSYKTIWRITLLCSHGEVHPFGTFESFQSELPAGSRVCTVLKSPWILGEVLEKTLNFLQLWM